MRIIGGARRGKILLDFDDGRIRPTGDRARQAIFNILASQNWIERESPLPEGASVLDLACGTGALGCEAMSRGASAVTFFDNNAQALKIAQTNARALNLPAPVRVEYADMTRLPRAAKPYDLIFCDPPYGQGLVEAALAQLPGQGYVSPQTLLVLETGLKETLNLPPAYELLDSRRYGAAMVWFVRLAG